MDFSTERMKLAEQFGFDSYVRVAEGRKHIKMVSGLNDGLGPDVVIVACASSSAQSDALEMAGKTGRIEFFVGLSKSNPYTSLNTNLIHYRELLVAGSFSQNIDEFKTALKLVSGETFPAKAIITHQFTMDEIVEAFELIEAGGSINVCVTPDL
jgi:L-iditol 2-dehydrogenase